MRLEALATPATLATALDPAFRTPPHVALMAQTVSDAVWAGDGRVVITMPPRHGKSYLCSLWTPVWFLELWPNRHVILASYGADFATRWSRKVRNAIDANAGDLTVRLAGDSRSAVEWETADGGGMKAVGVGGDITGRGAHLLVFDDPVKNPEEAHSDTQRDKLWEFWQSAARTRLEPGGTVVVVMTRWTEDDLVGRLLAGEDDENRRWTHVALPAIAEDDDALGRAAGEPLWPDRFSREDLEEIRADVGSYTWSALYQGRPAPLGGAIFQQRHFRYFTEDAGHYVLHRPDADEVRFPKNACRRIQLADTALKAKSTSDYTVVLTAAVTPHRDLLVLDVARDRLEVPEQLAFIRTQQQRWKPAWTGVEDKASGTGLLQTAKREGLALRPLKAETDKVNRAQPAAVLYENGGVYHRRDAAWLADFESGLLAFPNGTHDDQVDVVAYAVREMETGRSLLTAPFTERRGPRPLPEDADHPFHEAWRREQTFRDARPNAPPPMV